MLNSPALSPFNAAGIEAVVTDCRQLWLSDLCPTKPRLWGPCGCADLYQKDSQMAPDMRLFIARAPAGFSIQNTRFEHAM